jgi:hypothetical protein
MDFVLDERLFTAQRNLDHLFLKCRFASLDFGSGNAFNNNVLSRPKESKREVAEAACFAA